MALLNFKLFNIHDVFVLCFGQGPILFSAQKHPMGILLVMQLLNPVWEKKEKDLT